MPWIKCLNEDTAAIRIQPMDEEVWLSTTGKAEVSQLVHDVLVTVDNFQSSDSTNQGEVRAVAPNHIVQVELEDRTLGSLTVTGSTTTGELSVTNDPPSRYLTADDSVTIHNGNVVSIDDAWTTIFDIAAPTELLSGVMYARHSRYRLTIDGSVVVNLDNTILAARDGGGDVFNAPTVPPAKADNSMKLEITTPDTEGNDAGWLVLTR